MCFDDLLKHPGGKPQSTIENVDCSQQKQAADDGGYTDLADWYWLWGNGKFRRLLPDPGPKLRRRCDMGCI